MLVSKENKKAFAGFAEKWGKTLPPARPSRGDLKVYDRHIEELPFRPRNALVLGATPEIRDLLARKKIQVTISDFNINMIKAMSLLCKTKSKERILLANWMKKFTDDKFDLILSDAGLNMLNWKDWEKTLGNIRDMLTPRGYVLQKIAFYDKKRGKMNSLEIIKKWRAKKLRTPDMRWFLEMYSDYGVYDRKSMIDSKVKLLAGFEKSYKNGDLRDKEWEIVKRYDDKVVMTVPSKNKVNGIIKKYFRIVRVTAGEDFLYCQDMPVYLLKRKRDL